MNCEEIHSYREPHTAYRVPPAAYHIPQAARNDHIFSTLDADSNSNY